MSKSGHLWAIGFDDTGRAAGVRDEIVKLAWEKHGLVLLDVAVAVRYPDGCLTLNGERFPVVTSVLSGTRTSFLANLALGAPPLCAAAVGALLGRLGVDSPAVGISDEFVRKIAGMIKPGTSVLFVLDEAGNMDAILRGIRGLGGTVLKTNVDLERAKLIQSTLAAPADPTRPVSD